MEQLLFNDDTVGAEARPAHSTGTPKKKRKKVNPWTEGEPPQLQRSIGVTDLTTKKFVHLDFDSHWLAMFNNPERGFKALIYGPEKNGKTTFTLKLAKYLTRFGKVIYDSHEQGNSKTMQAAFIAEKMEEVAGKLMLLHKEPFEHLMYRCSLPNSGKFIIRDSIDYCGMTEKEYKQFADTYPNKALILICWTDKDDITPLSPEARKIKKRVDITIHIKNFNATPVSRFADDKIGNKPYQFGTPRINPGTQLSLLPT